MHFHYVLSLGAVFGIFSGFYHWLGFFTGKFYDRNLAKLHFWLTFIGSNLTFLPMHWLGISGMPRRIPDYPDMYSGWNFICTVGSYINVFGLFVFFFLLFLLIFNRNRKAILILGFSSIIILFATVNVMNYLFEWHPSWNFPTWARHAGFELGRWLSTGCGAWF